MADSGVAEALYWTKIVLQAISFIALLFLPWDIGSMAVKTGEFPLFGIMVVLVIAITLLLVDGAVWIAHGATLPSSVGNARWAPILTGIVMLLPALSTLIAGVYYSKKM